MKTYPRNHRIDLGILGGMGPRATSYFTEELLRAIESRHHPVKDQDYPSLLVRYACEIPDRTESLMGDLQRLFRILRREARLLVQLHCDKIIMPCITAHALLDEEPQNYPFIDIRKVVAEYLSQKFPSKRYGILATRGARLTNSSSKLVPDVESIIALTDAEENQLMAFIYGKAKSWNLTTIAPVLRLIARLKQRGCDAIVAGCTEIEMALVKFRADEPNIICPLKITARHYAANWLPLGGERLR